MNIVEIDIKLLKAATYNPRKDLKIGDEEYEKIKDSILKFGYVLPIIVNKNMTVVGGHQRLKILKDLDYKKVQCVVVDLDLESEKVLNVALNKIDGKFDDYKLYNILRDFTSDEVEFVGFTDDYVLNLLKDINKKTDEDNEIKDDELIICPKCKSSFRLGD